MNPYATAVLLAVSIGGLGWSLIRRFLPLSVMQPDVRWDSPRKRFVDLLTYAFGQLRFLRPFERFHCKQFHEITSLPAIFMHSLKPRGALTRMDLESEEALFGVGRIEDFSWKRGLDMYTCAECGRCQANCPAYLTDKPLSPMRLILDERAHLKRKTPLMCKTAIALYKNGPFAGNEAIEKWSGESLIGDVISEDAIWSCTMCGHCIANCPLMIEHVDNIIDMRRHLVQVKKIITACPHGYNTFKNEYPQFGKAFEVIHHTELLGELIRKGRINIAGDFTGKGPVVYHDSCYLGRYNNLYDRPRDLARFIPGLNLLEANRCRRIGFCCGAGGGRMWMDETLGKRINHERLEQLLAAGAKTVATACPYCMIMLDDAVKEKGLEEAIEVRDLAMMVFQSLQT